ncbi:MAG: sporulation protein YqfD [Dorea longicatena]
MFEQFIWYLKGYVRIRVSGYSPERFLNACRYKNIYIWDLNVSVEHMK